MEDFGLPTPNHNFLDAHPTVSSELLGRLGAGDAVAKGDVAELMGDRVRFADGSVEPVDAIIYATGYNVSFPFFRPRLPQRAAKTSCRSTSGCSSRASTISPSSASASRSPRSSPSPSCSPSSPPAGSAATGRRLTSEQMEREIVSDEAFHTAHFVAKPRHTMQLEWYSYKRELERRTIPAGQRRALRRRADRARRGRTRRRAGGRAAGTPHGGANVSAVEFDSGGVRVAAVHLQGAGEAFATSTAGGPAS